MHATLLIVWYAGALATLALIAHLCSSRLYRSWPAFTAWLCALTLHNLILIWFDPRTWLYARIWAYTDWFVLVAQIAMAGELLRCIWAYFKPAKWAVLSWIVAVLIVAAGAAYWTRAIELPAIRWDKPLVVQLTLVSHRVVALWLAGSVLASYASLQWAATFRRNIAPHTLITGLSWTAGSISQCVVSLSYGEAREVAMAARVMTDTVAVLLWIALLRSEGETETGTADYPNARLFSRALTSMGWGGARRIVGRRLAG